MDGFLSLTFIYCRIIDLTQSILSQMSLHTCALSVFPFFSSQPQGYSRDIDLNDLKPSAFEYTLQIAFLQK